MKQKTHNMRMWFGCIIAGSIVAGFLLYKIFPALWFNLFPVVTLYYLLLGAVYIEKISKWASREWALFIRSYIRYKVTQLILTLLFVLLYVIYWSEASITFLVVNFAYYMALLTTQTIIYTKESKKYR